MRGRDQHLSSQEIQELAGLSADTLTGSLEEAMHHVGQCDECRLRMLLSDELGLPIFSKGKSELPGRTPTCPPDSAWLEVAAGLASADESWRQIQHASSCKRCGQLLRMATEDLAVELTPEEEEKVAALASASPKWQRDLAAKIASGLPSKSQVKKPETARRNLLLWSRWAFAAAALVLVAVGGWFVWQRLNPDPNKLLAQAFTAKRTIELRMPGADYGRVRVERGANDKNLPAQFHKAEGIIIGELAKHPEDPAWLQAQARADLLQWHYDSAIKELDDALMFKPNDPALLTDKAMALFERAEKLGPVARLDYGEAAEDLSLVLKKNPDDLVALFNRAIIYEKIPAPNEAIADLEHYLRIEPTGGWADEARERLLRLKKLVKAHEDGLAEELADAGTFARLARDPSGVVQLDRRVEDYQELAIRKWMPSAFPLSGAPSRNALLALRALGKLLAEKHKDKWMNDLLADTASPTFPAGVELLGLAVAETAQGDPGRALAAAQRATMFFNAGGSRAGALRSDVEQVRSLQRSHHGDKCLAKGRAVEGKLKNVSYTWMTAQLAIDEASCSNMLKQFDAARSYISYASSQAETNQFRSLLLRAIGISASVDTDAGNVKAAWTTNTEGLSEYWRDPFVKPLRGQQFYDDLTYTAENLGFGELALAFGEDSVRMIALVGDKKTELLVREHLAKIAMNNGLLSLATEQLRRSGDLSSSLSDMPGLESYKFYAQVGLADVEMRQGKLAEADRRLKLLQDQLNKFESFTISRSFYETYGDLLRKQQKTEEAEQVFEKAIEIANSHFKGPDSASSAYFWMQDNSGLYRSLVDLELAKGDPQQALRVWEWYRSASFGMSGLSPGSLANLQHSDDWARSMADLKTETVISYAVLPRGIAIWAFDDRGVFATIVPVDPSNLANLASYFTQMCADPQSDLSRLHLRASRLFDLLVQPVAARLAPGRTLVIEPDEIISDVPFQALLTRDKKYLGQVYRIVVSPGLLYRQHLRLAAGISPASRALLVGSTASLLPEDESLYPAADVVDEVERAAENFTHPDVLKGQDATIANLQAATPRAEVFYFVGHAISTTNTEGLVMWTSSTTPGASAEIWGGRNIRDSLFKHCQLAVLSACSTGKAVKGRREVHGELVRSMLLAGVPQIVASRWNVDSRTTSKLMKYFCAELLSGKSAAVALQTAESRMRGQPGAEHPYYWAAFAAFGRA